MNLPDEDDEEEDDYFETETESYSTQHPKTEASGETDKQ